MSTFDDTIIDGNDHLAHYGILRKSGRYPWGSGGTEVARSKSFYDYLKDMERQGLSEAEIAAGLSDEKHPFTTTHLRQTKTLARNVKKRDEIHQAQKLREKGWSHRAIAERLGVSNESYVRSLLREGEKAKTDILHNTADFLRARVDEIETGVVDVGKGVEHLMGIARSKLDAALAILKDEGYGLFPVQIETATGLAGQKTTSKVLAKPGIEYRDVARNTALIKPVMGWTEDGGESFSVIKPPLQLSSKRLQVVTAENGGAQNDGVIYIREGKSDLSLGKARYAQVRISVDGTHFIKGMAMYKDGLPDGVDVQFHTNKKASELSGKLDALKPLKDDPTNPFGAIVRQIKDPSNPDKVTSVMNLVNEQGDWQEWSKTLSSQMLSKQNLSLIRQQLDQALAIRKDQLDEINSLTNPAVKKKLLEEFADSADSASWKLKAHAINGTANHVLLPLNSLKETEVYAPNYKTGDRVALIRHPHGGTFEIPELVVNNNHPEAKKLLGNAPDAIAINSKVAERLSGADFDGDTVLVIPNNKGLVKSTPALHDLKDFDPKQTYAPYDGMRTIDGGTYRAATKSVQYPIDPKTGKERPPSSYKQNQMGDVSNLITDMTIRGAPPADIARAVRHSMVVIDAEKHMLDYRQSAIDNGIKQLKEKYQKPFSEGDRGGASTLISRAKSTVRVPKTKPRPYADGGPIDPATGKKVMVPDTFTTKDGVVVTKTQVAKRLEITDNAHTLSSGTPVESLYADHSNAMKALANTARKEALSVPTAPYSPSANKAYAAEVDRLTSALKIAESNAPKERAAQVLARAQVDAKKAANPHMDKAELKKANALAIASTRARLNPDGKTPIEFSPREWEAVQAGALRPSRLDAILRHANPEQVKKLATPKATILMTPSKHARATSLLASGLTQAEVAEVLGVSLTTLKRSLSGGD